MRWIRARGTDALAGMALGNVSRLVVAALGGWLALRWGGGLTQVFIAQVAFGS